jgi:hypothetical protein
MRLSGVRGEAETAWLSQTHCRRGRNSARTAPSGRLPWHTAGARMAPRPRRATTRVAPLAILPGTRRGSPGPPSGSANVARQTPTPSRRPTAARAGTRRARGRERAAAPGRPARCPQASSPPPSRLRLPPTPSLTRVRRDPLRSFEATALGSPRAHEPGIQRIERPPPGALRHPGDGLSLGL